MRLTSKSPYTRCLRCGTKLRGQRVRCPSCGREVGRSDGPVHSHQGPPAVTRARGGAAFPVSPGVAPFAKPRAASVASFTPAMRPRPARSANPPPSAQTERVICSACMASGRKASFTLVDPNNQEIAQELYPDLIRQYRGKFICENCLEVLSRKKTTAAAAPVEASPPPAAARSNAGADVGRNEGGPAHEAGDRTSSSNPVAGLGLTNDTWKWWYYVLAGILVTSFGGYQLLDGSIKKGIGSILLGLACLAVGLFSRNDEAGSS